MSKKASAKSKTRKRKRNKTPPFMRPTRLQYLDGSPEHKKKKLFSLNPSKNRTPSERGTFIFIAHGSHVSSYENGVLTYKDTIIQADFLPLNSISFFVAKNNVLWYDIRNQGSQLPRKICDNYFENVDVTTPKDNKWTFPMTIFSEKLSDKQQKKVDMYTDGLWLCHKNGKLQSICSLRDMLYLNDPSDPALQYNRKSPKITIHTLFRYLNEFCHTNIIHPTDYDLRLFCCRSHGYKDIPRNNSWITPRKDNPILFTPNEENLNQAYEESVKKIMKNNLIRTKVLGKETKNQKKFNKTLKELKADFGNKMDVTGGDKTVSLEDIFEPVSKEEFKYKLPGPLPTKVTKNSKTKNSKTKKSKTKKSKTKKTK
jgi:hypothetical protein